MICSQILEFVDLTTLSYKLMVNFQLIGNQISWITKPTKTTKIVQLKQWCFHSLIDMKHPSNFGITPLWNMSLRLYSQTFSLRSFVIDFRYRYLYFDTLSKDGKLILTVKTVPCSISLLIEAKSCGFWKWVLQYCTDWFQVIGWFLLM